MIGSVRKFSNALDKAAQGLTVLAISSFTLLLFAAVVCRYLLKTSILFEEEGSKILFVWACFMGASVAYKRNAHIWFNFIERFIGRWGIAISDLIIHASTFCFFSYLFVDSINFLLQIWETYFPLIGVSQGWVYLALTVALGVLMVHNLLFLLESVQALTSPTAAGEKPR
jgi:TRAP-type C4-dicarboxylate transport system permease small subunit